jgi:RNA polymerase sigma-70 factor, ECF subfamily
VRVEKVFWIPLRIALDRSKSKVTSKKSSSSADERPEVVNEVSGMQTMASFPFDPPGAEPSSALPESDLSKTRPSLIMGARDPQNREARENFVAIYGPKIAEWCRIRVAQREDLKYRFQVEDVIQAVWEKVFKELPSFIYQKPDSGKPQSFRGWLRTVTERLMSGLARQGRRERLVNADLDDLEASKDEQARADLEHLLFRQMLLQAAYERARPRVAPKTWTAFWETALNGRDPDDVARNLGMKRGSVYQAKCKVTKLLREEIEALEEPE